MNTSTNSELAPKIVLAVGAHADDLECCAGGTLAKFAADGASVHYLVLTDGRNGTSDAEVSQNEFVARRQAEQRAAAEIMGVEEVRFGSFPDGQLENSEAVRRTIVRAIRELKPDLVVGWDPGFLDDPALGIVNHHDHRVAGEATTRAVYPEARDRLSFPDLYEQGLKPHNVRTLLMLTADTRTNFTVTVPEQQRITKYEAIRAHASQGG